MNRALVVLDDLKYYVIKTTVIISLLGLLVALLILSESCEARLWSTYLTAHHCVVIGLKGGEVVVTGNGVGFTSEQKVYRCDGGEIRIR